MSKQLTFQQLLRDARISMGLSQIDLAKSLGYCNQYICDMERGRRPGSVKFVNALCDWIGCDQEVRKTWHLAAARQHGWEV